MSYRVVSASNGVNYTGSIAKVYATIDDSTLTSAAWGTYVEGGSNSVTPTGPILTPTHPGYIEGPFIQLKTGTGGWLIYFND